MQVALWLYRSYADLFGVSSIRLRGLLNFGFSNFIFDIDDEYDYVVRVGLVHTGNVTLSFRGRNEVEYYRRMLQAHVCASQGTPPGALERSFFRLILPATVNSSSLDIETVASVLDESEHAARASALGGLVFGVAVSIHRVVLPLALSTGNTSNRHIHPAVPPPPVLNLAVELLLRADGDVSELGWHAAAGTLLLLEADLLLLCRGYFADQLVFLRACGVPHMDAHPRNILFVVGPAGRPDFRWADFGQPSGRHNSAGDEGKFREAVGELLACVTQLAVDHRYSRLQALLHRLATVVAAEDLLSEQGLAAVVASWHGADGLLAEYSLAEQVGRQVDMCGQ